MPRIEAAAWTSAPASNPEKAQQLKQIAGLSVGSDYFFWMTSAEKHLLI
jgi:hypothetical protein